MTHWTEQDIPPLTGKFAVVTGANAGLGWQTALELARKGAEVIVAARSAPKGHEAVANIIADVPAASDRVRFEALDLADLQSIRAFAAKVGTRPLDILINNAGVMNIPKREVTDAGFEKQFATNHLGPFALSVALVPALGRSPAARVTTVSSGAAAMGHKRINFEDPQWTKSYVPFHAYCQSKLANLLFMQEFGRRCAAANLAIISNAAHPGLARTKLLKGIFRFLAPIIGQDAAHGALPILRAATEPQAANGDYFGPHLFATRGYPIQVKLPTTAKNPAAASQLWALSESLTGVAWPLAR